MFKTELKAKFFVITLSSFGSMGVAQGAALDRSTQPSWAFSEPGTLAYVEGITISPKVSGSDIHGNAVPNLTKDHHFINYGAKADVNDRVSVGVYLDQPWGADVEFKGNNDYSLPATATKPAEHTTVTVDSRSFTGVVGVKLGNKKHISVYGGPVLQQVDANVVVKGAFFPLKDYSVQASNNTAVGWMAGMAYTKPEIALKAALTYRSEIEHNVNVAENVPLLAILPATYGLGGVNQNHNMTLKTPQSVNLDFQTGIAANTLLMAKVRWVPWSKFGIKPPVLNNIATTLLHKDVNLIDYSKDGWTTELGIGRKLSDKWAVSGAIGWDSGAGDPVNTLGPVKGNKNIGLGVKYNLTPEWAISGGAKYLKFGDAKGNLPHTSAESAESTVVGDFKNNNGWVYGLRLSYQKK